jgi:hypothetical protein
MLYLTVNGVDAWIPYAIHIHKIPDTQYAVRAIFGDSANPPTGGGEAGETHHKKG